MAAPKIDLCFSGWIRGVEVTQASNNKGKKVDVSKMSAKELVRKLIAGKLFVSLGDLLYEGDDEEVEMFDFEENLP
jgi:hypothetical protein